MKFLVVLVTLVGVCMATTTRSLQEDLKEFENKIPIDQIREIARRYLKTDPEFQSVVTYLQGPEWAKLTADVRAKPAVQRFFKYMKDSGIDLEAILNNMENIIAGAKPLHMSHTRSLRSFLDEVNKLIPRAELIVLLNQKLNTSPEFQEFFRRISNEESHQLVEEVRAYPEVIRLMGRLKEMGVKVDEAIAFIYKMFGWK